MLFFSVCVALSFVRSFCPVDVSLSDSDAKTKKTRKRLPARLANRLITSPPPPLFVRAYRKRCHSVGSVLHTKVFAHILFIGRLARTRMCSCTAKDAYERSGNICSVQYIFAYVHKRTRAQIHNRLSLLLALLLLYTLINQTLFLSLSVSASSRCPESLSAGNQSAYLGVFERGGDLHGMLSCVIKAHTTHAT